MPAYKAIKQRSCKCGCGRACRLYYSPDGTTFKGYSRFAPDCPRDRLRWQKSRRNRSVLRAAREKQACPNGTRRLHDVGRGLRYWQVKTVHGWKYEHRETMKTALGRNLKRHEYVHHINGDTLNNELSNLRLLSAADHNREHHVLPAHKWARKFDVCIVCHSTQRPHLSKGMCVACYQREKRKTDGIAIRAADRERYHRAHPDAPDRFYQRKD